MERREERMRRFSERLRHSEEFHQQPYLPNRVKLSRDRRLHSDDYDERYGSRQEEIAYLARMEKKRDSDASAKSRDSSFNNNAKRSSRSSENTHVSISFQEKRGSVGSTGSGKMANPILRQHMHECEERPLSPVPPVEDDDVFQFPDTSQHPSANKPLEPPSARYKVYLA